MPSYAPLLGGLALLIPGAYPARPTTPPKATADIKVFAYNVLAPCWAAPEYYPDQCPDSLDADTRRESVREVLLEAAPSTDFFALAETEKDWNDYFAKALSNHFDYFSAYHDDSYWESWITEDPPFARNGVAIAVNNQKYQDCSFADVALGTGNHVAFVSCTHKALNREVRVASVHFDSDTGGRRAKEAKALGSMVFDGSDAGSIDIIAGDFNGNTATGPLHNILIKTLKFVDVKAAVGLPIDIQTHPYTTAYNQNKNYGNIDHIVARGEGLSFADAQVNDGGVWDDYAEGRGGDVLEDPRACAYMDGYGSDHFSVEATLTAAEL